MCQMQWSQEGWAPPCAAAADSQQRLLAQKQHVAHNPAASPPCSQLTTASYCTCSLVTSSALQACAAWSCRLTKLWPVLPAVKQRPHWPGTGRQPWRHGVQQRAQHSTGCHSSIQSHRLAGRCPCPAALPGAGSSSEFGRQQGCIVGAGSAGVEECRRRS